MSFSLTVRIKDNVRKDGTSLLFMDCFIDGFRVKLPLKLYVHKKYFDSNKGEVKNEHPRASDYNMIIRQQESKINDIAVKFRLEGATLTPNLLKNEFLTGDSREDFLKFYDQQLELKKKLLSKATITGLKSTLKWLREFQDPIPFAELNYTFLKKFEGWLKDVKNNENNGRWKHFKNIKTITRLALESDIKFQDPFQNFKYNYIQPERTSLTANEVQNLIKIYDKKLLKENAQNVLQYFLFACFTGLRISDIQRINKDMIMEGHLVFMAHKTRSFKKIIRVPLSKVAQKFISENDDKLFITLSDQKTNDQLKKIAQTAMIDKKLTFHIARHTFASLFLESGGSVEVLQQILGHSKIETTMVYVKIFNERKKKEIFKMDDLFGN